MWRLVSSVVWALMAGEMCIRGSSLQFGCPLGSEKDLLQSLLRRFKGTLFLVIPNQKGGIKLEKFGEA